MLTPNQRKECHRCLSEARKQLRYGFRLAQMGKDRPLIDALREAPVKLCGAELREGLRK